MQGGQGIVQGCIAEALRAGLKLWIFSCADAFVSLAVYMGVVGRVTQGVRVGRVQGLQDAHLVAAVA
jgi:hypothetical protein